MVRFITLLFACGVGVLIAIPVRILVTSMLDALDVTDWNPLTVTTLAMIPVVFFIFRAFVGPARRFLGGGDPMDEIAESKKKYTGMSRRR